MDESAEPPRRPDPAPADDLDRLEALEQQVRQLTSRLAGWVEAQLVQALEDRRNDMKALRSELQVVLNEQLAGIRAESSSVLSVATRRLEVAQEQLGERVDAVAERVARPAPTDNGLEHRVRSAMSRLSESVEAKLGEIAATRRAEIDGLRVDIHKALAVQANELRTEIATAATALRARFGQAQERMDGIEERSAQAEDRLGQMVEAKLADVVERRRAELDGLKFELQEALARQLSEARAEIGTAVSSAHQRFVGSVEQLDERLGTVADRASSATKEIEVLRETVASDGRRVEALELHTRRTDARLTDLVEAKFAEVAERRQGELDGMKTALAEQLAAQVLEARNEITTTVANAHQRFVGSVEDLEERVNAVAAQATAATARVELLGGARASDARGVEALDAGLEALWGELRAALDAHLAEARSELAAGTTELAEREAALDRRSAEAMAGLEALGASVEASLREAEARLGQLVETRLAGLEPAAQVSEMRAELEAAVRSLTRKWARAQDSVKQKLTHLGEQVDALAAAEAKAASTEASVLAPVRSDLRQLQAQVAELAETVAELRPRRKPPAAPAPKPRAGIAPARRTAAVPAKKAAAVPAKKAAAVPAKKAAAPAKKAAAPAKKAATPAKKAAAPAKKAATPARRRPGSQ